MPDSHGIRVWIQVDDLADSTHQWLLEPDASLRLEPFSFCLSAALSLSSMSFEQAPLVLPLTAMANGNVDQSAEVQSKRFPKGSAAASLFHAGDSGTHII